MLGLPAHFMRVWRSFSVHEAGEAYLDMGDSLEVKDERSLLYIR
jgi:hypothetical protein